MSGLEKIISEISEEAKAEAQEIINKANAARDKELASATALSQSEKQNILLHYENVAKEIERSCDSALDLQRRRSILQAKQMVLSDTMDKALSAMLALPEDEYFELLIKMCTKYAHKGNGEMILNANDIKRMPKDFAAKVAKTAKTGATISVSADTRKIDGGFVLKYGDVEENCSFAALFDARRDELADKVRDVLFS